MFDVSSVFKNSQGKNTLRVKLDNGVELFYHLYDNPVQYAWQNLLEQNIQTKIVPEFSNRPVEQYREELYGLIGEMGFSEKDLNKLHAMFVESDKSPNWLKINHLIHQIESNSKLPVDLNYQLQFRLENVKPNIPVEEHYKLWLSTDATKWGNLFVGYETIGKDWLDIAGDQDDTKDLNVQSMIGSETVMSFYTEYPYDKASENIFYKWYLENPKDVPINDLNKLSLGRFLLGKLIITDVFLWHYHDLAAWYMPNHLCKLTWNRDVLSTATAIEEIEFLETDIAYKTLLEHTKLLQILK